MNRIAGIICGALLATTVGVANAELLLHYTFEQVDTDGVIFTTPDSSGRGNTGLLMNMDQTNVVPGRVGNALQFNGGEGDLGNRIELPADHPDFNRSFSAFTFAAWLKPVEVASVEPETIWIAGKMGGGGNRGWQIGLLGTIPDTHPNELLFGYFDAPAGTEQEVFLGPNASFVNDTWIHIAAVFEASISVKMYINGELALTDSGALGAMNGLNDALFQIGGRGNNQPFSWNGLMDEVYVYDHALTAEEIAALVPDVEPLEGDYNGNGTVDAGDYTAWRDTLGSTTDLTADGDGSLAVDQGDYDVWVQNFGSPGFGAGAAVVPEPSSALLTLAAFAGLALGWSRTGKESLRSR